MIDAKYLRKNLVEAQAAFLKHGVEFDTDVFAALETQRKALQVKTQELQNDRNIRSKAIGKAKAAGEDIQPLLTEVSQLGDELDAAEKQLTELLDKIDNMIASLPNILHESVPEGKDEADNIEIRKWGEPKQFDFAVKDHVDLGEALDGMSFELGAKITGSRFTVMSGGIARLHRALIQLMLDIHTANHGYQEVNVPYIVNKDSMFGTGQLPKFGEDSFSVSGSTQDAQEGVQGNQFYLVPTAEVPVTNIARDHIFAADELPKKFVCHSPCFRSEAGSYGKDTRGLIRQHQFEKVELVQLVKPEDSHEALEQLTNHAEHILQLLGLPYRVVLLCGGDTGFSSSKTYDLEVWLPAQNAYREISSCSNFADFQARRMQARWRNPETGKPELLHTLNGSGLAVGRTLVAILENFQDKDGKIHVPEILHQYMGGLTVIE